MRPLCNRPPFVAHRGPALQILLSTNYNMPESAAEYVSLDESNQQGCFANIMGHPRERKMFIGIVVLSVAVAVLLTSTIYYAKHACPIDPVQPTTEIPSTSTHAYPTTTPRYTTTRSTQPPTSPTELPSSSTKPPTRPTKPPTSSTQPPTRSTEPPTHSTQPPTRPTEPPTSSTQPPTSSTQPPTSSTQPPTTSTELPTSSTQPPTSSFEPLFSSTQPSNFIGLIPAEPSHYTLISDEEKTSIYSVPQDTNYWHTTGTTAKVPKKSKSKKKTHFNEVYY